MIYNFIRVNLNGDKKQYFSLHYDTIYACKAFKHKNCYPKFQPKLNQTRCAPFDHNRLFIRAPPLGGCPIVITLSVCLSVRPSVCLSVSSVCLSVRQKTLTLAITFLLLEISLSYLACVILMTRPFQRYQKFWTCDLDRDLWPTFEKTLTLAKTFLLLEIELSYLACVYLMTRPFRRNHKFWTVMWPWPWPLTYFWKTLIFAITLLSYEIKLSYLACVFLMTRPFHWYHEFWTCDLDRDLWPTFEKL